MPFVEKYLKPSVTLALHTPSNVSQKLQSRRHEAQNRNAGLFKLVQVEPT
jgi:hypothetical protein